MTLTTLLYVVWSSCHGEEVQEWESSFIKCLDDAVKGSSALQAALRRRWDDEVAVGLQKNTLEASTGT